MKIIKAALVYNSNAIFSHRFAGFMTTRNAWEEPESHDTHSIVHKFIKYLKHFTKSYIRYSLRNNNVYSIQQLEWKTEIILSSARQQ